MIPIHGVDGCPHLELSAGCLMYHAMLDLERAIGATEIPGWLVRLATWVVGQAERPGRWWERRRARARYRRARRRGSVR